MVSAEDRYKVLVQRVRENYGKIDVPMVVEMIKRPLAMKSNLHDAIMIPADQVMYLADAAAPNTDNFQACYQPYYKHDLNRYKAMMADLAKNYKPSEPAFVPITSTQPATTSKPTTQAVTIIRGIVPATLHRPIKPTNDAKLASRLKAFELPAVDFPYEMKLMNETEKYYVWQVTFPSAAKSPDPENNTVWCEYFQSKKDGPRPAVIVLHILQNDFTLPRIVCHTLANSGDDAILMKMAYYGERRPKDPARQKALFEGDMTLLINGIIQTVGDVRRTAEFLDSQPNIEKENIGICGISLGALVGSLTIGVDGNFPKAAIVLGGGNLVKMIQAHSNEVREINEYITKNNITENRLADILAPIEPLNYIDRARSMGVLLINAKNDHIIPPECTQCLAEHLPDAKIYWYDASHTSMVWYLIDAITKVQNFFAQ
jgi:dienelactone hydrolase